MKCGIEVNGNKGERCRQEGIPRKKEYPVLCPDCKSAYWDKPAKKRNNFLSQITLLNLTAQLKHIFKYTYYTINLWKKQEIE